jgi:ribonuclease HI
MQVKNMWGLGAIIRNEFGLVMAAATWRLPGFEDATTAEACALWKTMSLAKECGFRRVIFEGDCEKVIRQIQNSNIQDRSYLSLIVKEIQHIQSFFDKCSFRFTHRSGNKVADRMAQLAHTDPNVVWIEEVPLAVTDVYFL